MTTNKNIAINFNISMWEDLSIIREMFNRGNALDYNTIGGKFTERQLREWEERTNSDSFLDREEPSRTPTWEECAEERNLEAFLASEIPDRVTAGFALRNRVYDKLDDCRSMYEGYKWDRELCFSLNDVENMREARDLARIWWGRLEEGKRYLSRVQEKLDRLLAEQEALVNACGAKRGLAWRKRLEARDNPELVTPYMVWGNKAWDGKDRPEEFNPTREEMFFDIFKERLSEIQEEKWVDMSDWAEQAPRVVEDATPDEWWEAILEQME